MQGYSLGVVGVDPSAGGNGGGGLLGAVPRGLVHSPSMESLQTPMLGDAHGSGLDGSGTGGGGGKRWAPAPPQMTRSGRRRLVSPMQVCNPTLAVRL